MKTTDELKRAAHQTALRKLREQNTRQKKRIDILHAWIKCATTHACTCNIDNKLPCLIHWPDHIKTPPP